MLNIVEFKKNHGALDDKDYDGGIMYGTDTTNCPVKSYKKYLLKLNPAIKTLFQRPRLEADAHGPWYDAQVVGIKSLEKMMKNISIEACLSNIYTNHCIRATCVTTLDDAGFEARHIMAVSGHKSEASIRAYSRTKMRTKRKMSNVLSAPTTTTATQNPETNDQNVKKSVVGQQNAPADIA